MSNHPIADYALLSDRHSAALVARDGSVDWLCFPRFDSPSIFARLLGEGAGHWSVRATGAGQVTRRYLDRTMVLETTHRTPTGTVVVVDALAMGEGNKGHELGRDAPHLLLRQVTCTEGEVELDLEYAPRPEYGLIYPLLDVVDGGLTAIGGADVLVLSGPVALAMDRSSASGRLRLRRGEVAGFALHHSKQAEGGTARVWAQSEIAARLADTVSAWESWSDLHQAYVGPWQDLVHHSGRVLQALSFEPTGAICAAATTSLPETVGGTRNWDYRYAWARDASFTIEALWVAACPDEANQFFEYMTTSAAGSLERGADLQIMFGVGGERDLTERELAHLSGWRRSVPVRVGNNAWSQRQLDVYGELLNAVFRLSDHLFDQASRRVGPWPARTSGARPRPGSGHQTLPGRAGRCGRVALAGKGPRDLGGSERAPRLLVLQGDVLGGTRPGGGVGRSSRCHRPNGGMAAHSEADTRDNRDQRLERAGPRLYPVLRLRGFWTPPTCCFRWSGSFPPTTPECWPPSTRPSNVSRMSTDWFTATAPTTGSRARKAPFCCAPSGWPKLWPWPASRRGPASSSNGPPPSSTTSACLPRKSIPPAESCSATSRRLSATSGWSTRPGPFPRRNAGRERLRRQYPLPADGDEDAPSPVRVVRLAPGRIRPRGYRDAAARDDEGTKQRVLSLGLYVAGAGSQGPRARVRPGSREPRRGTDVVD